MIATTLQPIRPPLWLNAADVALALSYAERTVYRWMAADLKRIDAGEQPERFLHVRRIGAGPTGGVRVKECCVDNLGRPHEEAKMPPLFALPEVGR